MNSSKMSIGVDNIIMGSREAEDAIKRTVACLREAIGVCRRISEMAKRERVAISGELEGEGKVAEDRGTDPLGHKLARGPED